MLVNIIYMMIGAIIGAFILAFCISAGRADNRTHNNRVYIAHPLRGDIKNNTEKITDICRLISKNTTVTPVSPIHAFSFADPTGDQTQVFGYCRELLLGCSELWVFGDWLNSEGCLLEIEHAKRNKIPVRYCCMDDEKLYVDAMCLEAVH